MTVEVWLLTQDEKSFRDYFKGQELKLSQYPRSSIILTDKLNVEEIFSGLEEKFVLGEIIGENSSRVVRIKGNDSAYKELMLIGEGIQKGSKSDPIKRAFLTYSEYLFNTVKKQEGYDRPLLLYRT